MKKMADWKDYIEFEKNHTENIEKTKAFFQWLLDRFGNDFKDKEFKFGLEIGTGLSGGFLPFLKIKYPYAVDYVHGPIKEKAEELSFEDNKFGIVIISNTLDHCENPKLVAKQIKRVLKPGGILFIFNYFDEPDNHPWSFSDSKEILDMFTDLKVKYSHKWPKSSRSAFMVAVLEK